MKRLGVVILVTILTTACGPEDNTVVKNPDGKYPVLEVSPAGICDKAGEALSNCQVEIDQSQVFPGETKTVSIKIRNSGERPLLVEEGGVQLHYAPFEGEEPPAFELLSNHCDDQWATEEDCLISPLGEGSAEMPEELDVRVRFYRHDDDVDREARLVLTTDATNTPVLHVDLTTSAGFPTIQVPEEFVNFELVGVGEADEKNVNILNTGAADLVITGFTLVMTTGGDFYSVIAKGEMWTVGVDTAATGVTFDQPLVIPPGEKTFFKVRFEPQDAEPATALLRIFSNDPEKPDGVEVKLSGNESVPCIAVNPENVQFGGRKLDEIAVAAVEITSCGDAPLEIHNIALKEGSGAEFSVRTDMLDHAPSTADPVVIPVGAIATIEVLYAPTEQSPLDGLGNIILDEGLVAIETNALNKLVEISVSGAGVQDICPVAIIKSAEGDEVIPQTVMHLYGDESYSTYGAIQKWEWHVEQPDGAQSVFVPSYTFPNPTFEVNAAGLYKFALTVYDESGTPSCFPGTYDVLVIPDEAIHIELLWHTPEDPDETDTGPEAGSDLDLHFLHPWAAGPDLDGDGQPDGWFDIPFDTFWFNAQPNWNSYDPNLDDDPGLDRDDTDGAGPENINLDIPENVTYRVGVHYWNDHGYGASYATVRVYIYAQMVFEVTDLKMVDKDMCEICTIDWPSGAVKTVTDQYGAYKCTPNYQNPYFWP